ncbi:RNA-directed DNA polymerase, eukaryota [Tanacetum coccineum]
MKFHPAGQKLESWQWLIQNKEWKEGVSKPGTRMIYMKASTGDYEQGNKVCLLKKFLYGLKQSPRQWYRRFDEYMLSNGFKRSSYDSYVYYKSYAPGARGAKDSCMENVRDRDREISEGVTNPLGVLIVLDVCQEARHSVSEAEYMALTEAVKEAVWLRGLLEELSIELNTVAINSKTVKVLKVLLDHNACGCLYAGGIPVKVGQTMGYNMDGCMKNMEDIIDSQGVDRVHRNSGGILCVWESSKFVKENVTVSDYFLAIMGMWVPTSTRLLLIVVYAPQDVTEKRTLWDYLSHVINRWDGESVVMGDFNEVRSEAERFGSIFNAQGAHSFNNFISLAGLVDLPLGGYSFTWSHKTANKMSKIDRFLISEGMLETFQHLLSVCLDRHLSDHRPILMREVCMDYGPIPFRFYHSWFQIEGFDKLVEDSWKEINIFYSNPIVQLKKKLQTKLSEIDIKLDQGGNSLDILNERTKLVKDLHELDNIEALEIAQKAKVRWSIEGDENTKYFHGIVNKKRSQLAIRGVLAEGDWIEDPVKVEIQKNTFRRLPMEGEESEQYIDICMEGEESEQYIDICNRLEMVQLSQMHDRWFWSLVGTGEFSVKSVRNLVDDTLLHLDSSPTRWIKMIPIKVNVFVWRVRMDKLPTRLNLSLRGVDIPSILCPVCDVVVESTSHILFSCPLARDVLCKVMTWWDLDTPNILSYEEWLCWFSNLHIHKQAKIILEGVFYVMWWLIWRFRNKSLFGSSTLRKAIIFDDIVTLAYTWCSNRCKSNFNWVNWMQNPKLAIL